MHRSKLFVDQNHKLSLGAQDIELDRFADEGVGRRRYSELGALPHYGPRQPGQLQAPAGQQVDGHGGADLGDQSVDELEPLRDNGILDWHASGLTPSEDLHVRTTLYH